jgi:hypothetical protein
VINLFYNDEINNTNIIIETGRINIRNMNIHERNSKRGRIISAKIFNLMFMVTRAMELYFEM